MSRAEIIHTIAIIGVGSPFGSDQLGWQAVDWLAGCELGRQFPALQLKYSRADRPGALLLEQLGGVEGAVIIDAMQGGLPPNTLRTFTPEQMLEQCTGLVSCHGFGIADSIALGASLGELPQHLLVIGIEMGREPCEVVIPLEAAHQIEVLVDDFLSSFQQKCAKIDATEKKPH